jgi:hypothetical protein
MSTVSVRLPDGLHRKLQEIAMREDIPLDRLISSAAAEKAAAMLGVEYLEERARQADPTVLARILSRVPKVPPMPGDELPPVWVSPLDQPAKAPSRRKRRVRSK